MTTPRLFFIDRTGPGRLATMAAPRGGETLADEMQALAHLRITTLVSMLTGAEERELDLVGEGEAARSVGLRWRRLATPDRGLPDKAAALKVSEVVIDRLRQNESVAIHCRAGIGRASLLAACVLTLEHVAPDEAWTLIAKARGLPVPDTPEQRSWLAGTTRNRYPA